MLFQEGGLVTSVDLKEHLDFNGVCCYLRLGISVERSLNLDVILSLNLRILGVENQLWLSRRRAIDRKPSRGSDLLTRFVSNFKSIRRLKSRRAWRVGESECVLLSRVLSNMMNQR
jgi:hypothetical protein